MPRNVLVIGAQGVIGSFIAKAFSEAGWSVTRAGRRREDAADFRLVDLDKPETVSAACKDADLVVSSAHHPELVAERTVLREGGTLIALTELSGSERTRLGREVADARGLVVSDTGLGGVAYLALAELLSEHAGADAGHYALMFSASGATGRAGALFAHGLITGGSHHPTAKVPFPEPFGERRCLEIGTGPGSDVRADVGGKEVHHYLCMQPPPLHGMLLALNKLRLISILPRASFTSGTGKVPDEPTSEPICEWVSVTRDGQRLAAQSIQGEGYYAMTASATLVFGQALEQANGHRTGLHSVDRLLTLADVRPALEERGIAVRRQGAGEPARNRDGGSPAPEPARDRDRSVA